MRGFVHPPIGPLVHWSVGLLVHWFIGPLVCQPVSLSACQPVSSSRNTSVFEYFLVAYTQLYKKLCPSVRRSVSHGDQVDNECFRYFFCMFESWTWGVWMRVGCPCPPVRNDIVTPRHLLLMFEGVLGVVVWIRVGCPRPPIHNIVTLHYMLYLYLRLLVASNTVSVSIDWWVFWGCTVSLFVGDYLFICLSIYLSLSVYLSIHPSIL